MYVRAPRTVILEGMKVAGEWSQGDRMTLGIGPKWPMWQRPATLGGRESTKSSAHCNFSYGCFYKML